MKPVIQILEYGVGPRAVLPIAPERDTEYRSVVTSFISNNGKLLLGLQMVNLTKTTLEQSHVRMSLNSSPITVLEGDLAKNVKYPLEQAPDQIWNRQTGEQIGGNPETFGRNQMPLVPLGVGAVWSCVSQYEGEPVVARCSLRSNPTDEVIKLRSELSSPSDLKLSGVLTVEMERPTMIVLRADIQIETQKMIFYSSAYALR